jgi:bifunctional non-homologous end joining protein LigD
MSLKKYNEKRKFDETPEPKGGKAETEELRFVIQKHDASHLHYDFRLEMDGVLKSWAVPKGPSTDPEIKRLAMAVEDHPYDYRTFEGIIPGGNYGAGTVIVWDEGTYTPLDKTLKDKKSRERELLKELHQGNLKFTLKGKKLKGEFALVKTKGYAENSWLLIKHDDRYASKEDITLKDKSVISGKTLGYIEEHSTNTWQSNKASSSKKEKVSNEKPSTKPGKEDNKKSITDLLRNTEKAPFPAFSKPMLAMRADKPFNGDDWLYEIKWDGYRALAYLNGKKAELLSRNEQSFTAKFSAITRALKDWNIKAVIDGEIIAENEDGYADFQALQNFARKGKEAKLVYYVFDVLWYEGKDVRHLALEKRKELLKRIVPDDSSVIRYSDHIIEKGTGFFDLAKKQGLEGIMAKKASSEYITGTRTDNWLKIKNDQVTEAIICGYTKGRNSRQYFGAIILGKYINRKLTYIGHSGSGFNDEELKEMHKRFEDLTTDVCPFKEVPKTNMPAVWLKPELVCEVKFAEWTGDNILRQPIFKGLRADKTAKTEKSEKVVHITKTKTVNKVATSKKAAPAKKTAGKKPVKKAAASKTAADKSATPKKTAPKKSDDSDGAATVKKAQPRPVKKSPSADLFSADMTEEIMPISGHEIKFTNLNKIYWPADGITKGDMLNYYHKMAEYILPYMKDRPQSLNRYPEGINGFSFYQKDVTGKVPDWIKTYDYFSESNQEHKEYLVCTDEASLLYMASLGCIEMHPWHSRIQKPDNPDWCLIDLDPDNNSYDKVVEVALVIKQLLDSAKVPAWCKTSGSTGMHICIPLGARYTYDQSKLLAELIVNIVHNELPKFTSVERAVNKRKGKIYLDFLQNRHIQTVAAPYSLRPKSGATASAPLDWSEVKKGLRITDFHIGNMHDRVRQIGDLFKGILGKGIDLKKTIDTFNGML